MIQFDFNDYVKPKPQVENKQPEVKPRTKASIYAGIFSGVGFAIALIYCVKTKSGFGKGVLYTFLGSTTLGGIGYGVGSLQDKK